MDSINQQQPEQNRRDLAGSEAVKRVKDMVDDAKSCFFCTGGGRATGPSRGVRPMSVREVDDAGTIWFLSASDSHKNEELAANPAATLYFQADAHAGFLELAGRAEVLTDRARIKDLWNFMLRTWFTEGEDDPRITVIRFVPERGYYWDNKHGNAVAGAKIAVGAAIGKTLDDSIEGQLRF
ncbi:MAG: pyridoxamine 5'-phosphate oxidase family protein [Ramlibacter sp.]